MEVNVLRGTIPSGSGYGDGDGYGYGDGYDDGSGSGYGDGYDYGYYWSATIDHFVAKWEPIQISRLSELRTMGAKIAFWRSRGDGTAANGGKNKPVKPGTIEKARGPLRDECGEGQLHATLIPPKWKGERWWIVALIGEVRGSDEKYWALKREIIGEAL